MRDEPLSSSGALTRDYINRAVKMREIEGRMGREKKWHGWRLLAVWVVAIGLSVWAWVALWNLIFGERGL